MMFMLGRGFTCWDPQCQLLVAEEEGSVDDLSIWIAERLNALDVFAYCLCLIDSPGETETPSEWE